MFQKIFSAAGLAIFFSISTQAYVLEIVQSVPVETTLKVPGIRETQEVWVEMLNSAKSSIDLEQFYIHHQEGKSLEPVIQALVAAAARGVQIRMMVDSKFFQNYSDVPKQLTKIRNIQVRILDYSVHGGVQHAKFFVVDRERSFLGSANFDWLALSHIHEVGLRVEDASIAKGLASVFDLDWSKAKPLSKSVSMEFSTEHSMKDPIRSEPVGGMLLASPVADLPSGITPSLKGVPSVLAMAKKSIQIQVYQYSTKGNWNVLDLEIRKAASRGVKVSLIVDNVAMKNSSKELLALSAVNNVQVKTVTIPVWSGGVIPYSRLIHSKYFTVDGMLSWIGTENWSEGYFTSCRNVGLILESKTLTSQLDQIFQQVWNSPYTRQLR